MHAENKYRRRRGRSGIDVGRTMIRENQAPRGAPNPPYPPPGTRRKRKAIGIFLALEARPHLFRNDIMMLSRGSKQGRVP